MKNSRLCIKANALSIVNISTLVLPLVWCAIGNAIEPEADLSDLPPISATKFPVKIVRRSNSNNVYLLDDEKNAKPPRGRLLLLKKRDESFMAFRVLRLYSEKQYLAVKKLRTYGDHKTLDDGDAFTAIQKISDSATPDFTDGDRADLKELEASSHLKAAPYDPDLDAAPPGSNTDKNKDYDESPSDTGYDEDDLESVRTIQESKVLDPFDHWLMAGFGYARNAGAPGSANGFYFSSGHFKYGLTVKSMPFLRKPNIQDSFVLEAGFYLYKALSYISTSDSYTVMAWSFNARYNIMTSQSFGFFGYLGAMKGVVLASANSTDAGVSALSSIIPSFGVGLLIQMGPQWYTRVDIGYESQGLTLILRF